MILPILRIFLILLSLAALPAWAAEDFGDQVARCLVAKGVNPDPDDSGFKAAAKVCEREIDLGRRRANLDRLKEDWQLCLLRNIEAIDDGVSPASDIATAVQSTCSEEYAAMGDAVTMSQEAKYQVYQDRFKTTKGAAIPIVLIARAAKNKAKQ